MKRNLIISAIAISSVAAFIYIKSQTGSIHTYSLKGEYERVNDQVEDPVGEPLQSAAGVFSQENTFKPFNKESGEIGFSSLNGIDNPADNEFRFNIDIDPASKSLAFLEYELYGVRDFGSVCRSVNENLSTGGLFVQLSDQWSSQVEMIPASSLRQGFNIVRFSIPDGLEYGYKVKNLRIRFADEMIGERRIVINQTSQMAYYNSVGYVTGFITGAGSQSARIYLDGKEIRNDRAVFEGKVNNGGETSGTWKSSITAVFSDGQEITSEIEFSESQSYDYEGTYSVNAHFAKQYCIAEQSASLEVPGFRLTAESGSVSMPVELSVTGLRSEDMAMMDAAMLNVTGGARGFRCLPHGMQFDKPVEIRIKYDSTKIPMGYGPQDIRTYFYDEVSGHWVVLPTDSIDESAREIVSHSTHFTDFVNAILKTPENPATNAFTPTSLSSIQNGDPMAPYNIISPPEANNFGTANLQFPIIIPGGRQGMQPHLAINYSSGGSNGWLGVGWELGIPAITVETRWGVPHYFSDLESESYLISGEQLLPMIHRDAFEARNISGDKIFSPRVEGAFNRIVRHGNAPDEYWWEVIDKRGVRYYYGKYSTDNGVNPQCVLSDANGNIAHWALAEIRDLNDNFVKYNYTIIQNTVNASPGYMGKQIYPSSVNYTGHGNVDGAYSIIFHLSQSVRSDYFVTARYGFPETTNRLLDAIEVRLNNQFIKGYVIKYKQGAFKKNLICTITEVADLYLWNTRNNNGDNCEGVIPNNSEDELRPKVHRFEYFNDSVIGFTSPQILNTYRDDDNLYILNGNVNVSNTPALGKSFTTGWSIGGSINIGIGLNCFLKSLSLGGSYTYNEAYTKDHSLFIDINSDGIPDRVFKSDDVYKYRPLEIDANGNLTYSNSTHILTGLPRLGKTNSNGRTWGIEGQIAIVSASAGWTKNHNYNIAYFEDVNADGYPDFIDDGQVYYNNISNPSSTTFVAESSSEIQYLPGSSCNYILRSGEVNYSVYTPLPGDEADEMYSFERDAVRLWVAPYAGTISINNTVQLVEDTSYSRLQSVYVDGVVAHIQHGATIIRREPISKDDYSSHSWNQQNISVNKGDKIYFRLLSRIDRNWDDVKWNPTIFYQQIGGINIDTNSVDAEGKKIAVFRPSDDLLIYNNQIFQAPYSGNIRVRGHINVDAVSDTVWFSVLKGQTALDQHIFNQNSSGSYYVDELVPVNVNDTINLIAYTKTNVNWHKITNDIRLYYYSADSVEIDTNSDFNRIEVLPMIQYNMHQNPLQKSKGQTLTAGSYTILPAISASGSMNGSLLLTAKKGNLTLAKKLITIVNGSVQGNPSISFSLSSTATVYFDYYIDSLGTSITSAKVRKSGSVSTMDAGLHTFIDESMLIFGNLYRGWGQFSYNDGDTSTFQPIDESDLHLNGIAQDTSLIDFDPNAISNYNSAVGQLSASGANDPLNEPFSVMFPDLDSMNYRDYSRLCCVGKSYQSNSPQRVGQFSQEVVYDSPLIVHNSSVPVRSIRKYSVDKTFAYSVGAQFLLSGGYSHNNTETQMALDYFDLNGDRYPDIVGLSRAQFSTPQGGIFENVTEGLIDYNVSSSTSIGWGLSYGVILPACKYTSDNTPSNSGTTNTSTSGTNSSSTPSSGTGTSGGTNPSSGSGSNSGSGSSSVLNYLTDAKTKCGGGGSTYMSASDEEFTFRDINGDGLPDKVHRLGNGFVKLNYGYQFGPTENWVIGDYGHANGTSQSANLGVSGEFNTSGYSWAGGINMSWSKTVHDLISIDMNGDGLPDIVEADGSDNTLTIYLNNGHGFSPSVSGSNADTAMFMKSAVASAYLSGSAGFSFCGIAKIVINLQIGLSGTVNQTKLILTDINNDGYIDVVTIDENGDISVRYSTLGKINVLKTVTIPTGGMYSIDYKMSSCNQDMPQRHLLMASLSIFDGFIGDGNDSILFKFGYGDGYYDRFERQFYGFDSVASMQFNSFAYGGFCYRSTISKYNNRNYLLKGLMNYSAILSGTSSKYIESFYTYDIKEISTGKIIPLDSMQCYGPYYPALSKEDIYYYEGYSNWQIHTKKRYDHGNYGNIKKYHNYGDVADANDDIIVEISYTVDTLQNILALPDSIIVKDTNGTILRKRTASYNSAGQLIQLVNHLTGSTAITDIDYDTYGNISSVQYPENSTNERASLQYSYDAVTHSYPTEITDHFGYASHSSYDLRFGLPESIVDISGNETQYTYYPDGKPHMIIGPKELANSRPYSIKFEYQDEYNYGNCPSNILPFCKTTRFDEQSESLKQETYVISDPLGKLVQTQEKITILGNDSVKISGKILYDNYGRARYEYLPQAVSIDDAIQTCGVDSMFFYQNLSSQDYKRTDYDILDRVTAELLPDQTTTSLYYSFGNDHFGSLRFKTTYWDELNNPTITFSNYAGLKTSVLDAIGGYTDFVYNPLGELLQSIDPESFVTEYNYDMLGRITQRNHPDAGTTTYVFDGAGNLNSLQTQNLQNVSEQIEYEYNFSRLSRVYYPLNSANDVFYEYGDYNSGNQAGKVTKMEDASGVQEFEYGNMGEIVQNIHTFIVPGGTAYTFETDFEYDSWNRIMQIVYPDGEIVSYAYNNGGQLKSVSGIKGPDNYSYIQDIRYDLYGNKKDVLYGNNTLATYSYDPLNLRLTKIRTYDGNSDMMQDIDYLYDNASNIVEFTNAADAVNGDLGGEYSMRFEYDNIYRLSAGFGDFNSFNNGTLPYQLSMEYSPSGNIVNKTLSATTELVGTLTNLSYDRVYSYNDRPHTVSSAGEYDYLWDANGNQIRSANNNNGQNRVLCWDEENRLMSVRNEGELANNLSVYLYQAGGDRVWKLSGENQQMLINGQNWVNMVNFNKTLYASPYMVMTEQEYTKHYFAGSERICSKLGSGFELSPVQVCDNPLTSISGRTAEEIATSLRELVESSILCTDYNGEWVIDASLQPACNNGNETEKELYFYHSDHLGSSAFITDVSGNAIQHLQYLPFGESFIDQRHDVPWHAPYTFSAKEKDEETSYSYFGARYYDSDLSMWLSVDPLASIYPSLSPYNYCANNPVILIDPTGMGPDDWFEDKAGNLMWRNSDADSYTDNEGTVWKNVGESAAFIRGDQAYFYYQTVDESGNQHLHSKSFQVSSLKSSTSNDQSKDAVLSMQHSQWSADAAQEFWADPSMGNWISYCFKEVLSQYTDPVLVTSGLAAGVIGIESIAGKATPCFFITDQTVSKTNVVLRSGSAREFYKAINPSWDGAMTAVTKTYSTTSFRAVNGARVFLQSSSKSTGMATVKIVSNQGYRLIFRFPNF